MDMTKAHYRSPLSLFVLGFLGIATSLVAVGIAAPAPSAAERLNPARQPVAALVAARGLQLQRAYGADDEDCVYQTRTVVRPGEQPRIVKTLICNE
ncbi:MAG: hypothetical protein JO273_01160 [Methylobacteriaceae bacterium]|nr:hypothetical protein [Methylobacteriaceae bacterium]